MEGGAGKTLRNNFQTKALGPRTGGGGEGRRRSVEGDKGLPWS